MPSTNNLFVLHVYFHARITSNDMQVCRNALLFLFFSGSHQFYELRVRFCNPFQYYFFTYAGLPCIFREVIYCLNIGGLFRFVREIFIRSNKDTLFCMWNPLLNLLVYQEEY